MVVTYKRVSVEEFGCLALSVATESKSNDSHVSSGMGLVAFAKRLGWQLLEALRAKRAERCRAAASRDAFAVLRRMNHATLRDLGIRHGDIEIIAARAGRGAGDAAHNPVATQRAVDVRVCPSACE